MTDTDGTLRGGDTSKHLLCGDGHANIPESLRVLREGGFRGWMDMDGWRIPDPYDACGKVTPAGQLWCLLDLLRRPRIAADEERQPFGDAVGVRLEDNPCVHGL